jgi:hypothetical protein
MRHKINSRNWQNPTEAYLQGVTHGVSQEPLHNFREGTSYHKKRY